VKRNDYDDDDGNNNNNNNSNINNNLRCAAVRTNRPRGLVTHTDQSDYRFP
jgi:hypothetical protein